MPDRIGSYGWLRNFTVFRGLTPYRTRHTKSRKGEAATANASGVNEESTGVEESKMSAIEPAGEKIVRNLQQAVERLQDDLARVELWAGALGCFTKPIPGYGHGQTKFDLPALKSKSADRASEAQ